MVKYHILATFLLLASKLTDLIFRALLQPYHYPAYIVKGSRVGSAGSNGQVDLPYHHGHLVEWYFIGFRGFGGVSDRFQAILVKPGLSGEPLS